MKQILIALIETGQRHASHARGVQLGEDACARSRKNEHGKCEVYCRYGFPRDLFLPDEECPGEVQEDRHRKDLLNLLLRRNDRQLNNYNAHLLLANLGNIDWRALLNLWSVLEYLTKYTSKAGKGSRQLGTLFKDVLESVNTWELKNWTRTSGVPPFASSTPK